MLELKSVNLTKDKIETLVIPVCEDKEIHDNQTIVSVIKKAKMIRRFKGEKDEEVIFYDSAQINAERLIFLGLGKLEKTDAETLRVFAGKSVKKCITKDPAEVMIAVPSEKKTGQDMAVILEAMISGALLGNHLFDKYKTEKKQKPLKNISLFMTSETAKKFRGLASSVSAVCEGTILAREWVSIPSNDKSPEQLAQLITKAAGKKELKVTVLKENELKKKGFGAILAVGSGSENVLYGCSGV